MNFRALTEKYLLRQTWHTWIWMLRGRRIPPPGAVKQLAMARYARQYSLLRLIETGTHYGDMVAAMRTQFPRIDSIEIFEPLYLKGLERFAGQKHIHLHHGDSGTILPTILSTLREPALFWLDAHYSGEGTGRGSQDTPILEELKLILNQPVRGHVILIDDARLFVGRDGYPTVDELRDFVGRQHRDKQFMVRDDIIRILPS